METESVSCHVSHSSRTSTRRSRATSSKSSSLEGDRERMFMLPNVRAQPIVSVSRETETETKNARSSVRTGHGDSRLPVMTLPADCSGGSGRRPDLTTRPARQPRCRRSRRLEIRVTVSAASGTGAVKRSERKYDVSYTSLRPQSWAVVMVHNVAASRSYTRGHCKPVVT